MKSLRAVSLLVVGLGCSSTATRNAELPVGRFTVSVDGQTGTTLMEGVVYDGPRPSRWAAKSTAGGCTLYVPSAERCQTSCQPTSLLVAEVVVSGVRTASGATTFAMASVADTYRPGEPLGYPPFAEGELVRLTADGGPWGAFSLEARGIAPMSLSSAAWPTATANPVFTWTPASAGSSRASVRLDLDRDGGAKGMLECETDDDGSAEVDVSLVWALMALDPAGSVNAVVSRASTGSVVIAPGRVDLVLSSSVERALEAPRARCTPNVPCLGGDGGLHCSTECEGRECGADLTCAD